MSRLAIICTVCVMFVVCTKGRQINNIDIKELLRLIEKKSHVSTSSDESSSSDEDYPNALRTMDVLDLIQKSNLNEKFNKALQNELLKKQALQMPKEKLVPSKQYPLPFIEHRNVLPSTMLTLNKGADEDIDLNELLKQQVLDSLIKNGKLTKKKSKLLVPNRLLSPVTFKDDDEREEKDDLNEYSKMFVILDASAVQKNGNKYDEESLISKILSLSPAMNKKSRQEKNKLQYYKGFRVKDDLSLRRYRRESKEGYGGDNDDEPVKKRPSGGGGGLGRTGIPNVKNRGDIYERDH